MFGRKKGFAFLDTISCKDMAFKGSIRISCVNLSHNM